MFLICSRVTKACAAAAAVVTATAMLLLLFPDSAVGFCYYTLCIVNALFQTLLATFFGCLNILCTMLYITVAGWFSSLTAIIMSRHAWDAVLGLTTRYFAAIKHDPQAAAMYLKFSFVESSEALLLFAETLIWAVPSPPLRNKLFKLCTWLRAQLLSILDGDGAVEPDANGIAFWMHLN